MKCPGCGAPRAIADQVCRACRLRFETGERIDLRPPRAAEGRATPFATPGPGRRLASRLRAWIEAARPRAAEAGWPRRALLGLVPGLGHALSGDRRRGALFAAAVLGLVALSMLAPLGQAPRMACIALAVAVHALSIFDLTPWRDDERAPARVAAVVAIQVALSALWWPLVTVLLRAFVGPALVPRARAGDVQGAVALGVGALVVAAVLALVGLQRAGRRLREER